MIKKKFFLSESFNLNLNLIYSFISLIYPLVSKNNVKYTLFEKDVISIVSQRLEPTTSLKTTVVGLLNVYNVFLFRQ